MGSGSRTVLLAEDEAVDRVETEEAEEVPGDGGDPADVQIARLDSALEHALEAKSEGEGESGCEEGVSFVLRREGRGGTY